MGPIVILDKSAFQSLSHEELGFLNKHYTVNIPPILILDMLADLKQDVADQAGCQQQVAGLAEKLSLWEARLNVHYRALCIASLLGHELAVTGMPAIGGCRVVRAKDGREDICFDETNERKAVRCLREYRFPEAEALLVARWQEVTRQLSDPFWFRKSLATHYIIIPKVTSLRKVVSSVDPILLNANIQTKLLRWFMASLALPSIEQDTIIERWAQKRTLLIRDWAPYAFFCIRVMFTFHTAASYNIFGSSLTDLIDMEYLFYLPFCMAFCSGNKLHARMAPMLLSPQQDFVPIDELRADLHWLVEEWRSLSKRERETWAYDYGNSPPRNDNSITHRLWKKHMKLWEPGSGNRTTKEQQQEILERIRPFINAIDEITGKEQQAAGNSE